MARLAVAVTIAFLATIHWASSPNETSNRTAELFDQGPTNPAPISTAKPITGLVLDDTGQPVADAQVIIDRVDIRNQMQFINTDAAGRFKSPTLAPGLYAMAVQSLGYIIQPEGTRPGIHRPGEHLIVNLVRGGVITGRVTGSNGEPAVSLTVTAQRVRDLDGRRLRRNTKTWTTDDRGIYRLYGLDPGQYVVSVSEGSEVYAGGSATGDQMPTYYPSAKRDGAVEISVRTGEEVSGIDVEMRRERGHAIIGMVSGDLSLSSPEEGIDTHLVSASVGEIYKTAMLYKANRFAFYGVPDGEYDLYAQKLNRQNVNANAGSARQRVVLRGADLIGVELKLVKYGAISGRVTTAPVKPGQVAPHCEGSSRNQLEEVMLHARSDSATKQWEDQFFVSSEYWGSWRGSVVDSKGGFAIHNLTSGLYRLDIGLPGEEWYVRSVSQPSSGVARKSIADQLGGIAVRSGENVTGIDVLIAEDGASVRGQVVLADETLSKDVARRARTLQIHLVPAEEAAAGDLLRYGETLQGKGGSFEFKNRAPGRYWLFARRAPEVDSVEVSVRPVAWDEDERRKLLREAKASMNEIELKPCQRLVNYSLNVILK